MNINIICVGKMKEQFMREACEEYKKRLSRFAKVKITEISDEPIPEKATKAEEESVLKKEAKKIFEKLCGTSFIVSLCVEGGQMSSPEFAQKIADCALSGKSDITFIIGGSLGLSEEIKKKSNLRLSFSRMTFPHQLMRVVLLEQIYRAFKINANESYHK